MSILQKAKQLYLQTLIDSQVIKFGEFETKSGRISPYFVNLGDINSGEHTSSLSVAYADYFEHYFHDVEQIYGPAYKGIPLVSSLSPQIWQKYNRNVRFIYNRKEAKKHGEGGSFVGEMLKDQPVVIVEDVLTGGVSIDESIALLKSKNINIVGCLVGLDRCERSKFDQNKTASRYVSSKYNIPVVCIASIFEFINLYKKNKSENFLANQEVAIQDYQSKYCLVHA